MPLINFTEKTLSKGTVIGLKLSVQKWIRMRKE